MGEWQGGVGENSAGKTGDYHVDDSMLQYSLLPKVLTSVLVTAKVPKD